MPYAYRGDNCYGRGDYYRGDYYRGDPGLFDILGKAAKAVGGAVVGSLKGLATGSPLAGAIGGVVGAVRGFTGRAPALPAPIGQMPVLAPFGTPSTSLLPSPIGPLPVQPLGAAVGAAGFGAPTPGMSLTPSGALVPCQMKGYHPNRSGYFRNPRSPVFIPAHSVCVKTRRLNVANPRALRRAIRRATGFAKLARRVLTFVSAKAPKGRARFKKKR